MSLTPIATTCNDVRLRSVRVCGQHVRRFVSPRGSLTRSNRHLYLWATTSIVYVLHMRSGVDHPTRWMHARLLIETNRSELFGVCKSEFRSNDLAVTYVIDLPGTSRDTVCDSWHSVPSTLENKLSTFHFSHLDDETGTGGNVRAVHDEITISMPMVFCTSIEPHTNLTDNAALPGQAIEAKKKNAN